MIFWNLRMPNIKLFQTVFCRWRCGEFWMTSKSRLACLDSSPMKASFKPDRIVWKLQERNFCKICLLIANSLCRTLCQKIVRTLRHVFIDFIWRNPRSKSEILTILPFLSLSPQRIWKVEASRLTQRTKKKERKKVLLIKTLNSLLRRTPEKKKFVSVRPFFLFVGWTWFWYKVPMCKTRFSQSSTMVTPTKSKQYYHQRPQGKFSQRWIWKNYIIGGRWMAWEHFCKVLEPSLCPKMLLRS